MMATDLLHVAVPSSMSPCRMSRHSSERSETTLFEAYIALANVVLIAPSEMAIETSGPTCSGSFEPRESVLREQDFLRSLYQFFADSFAFVRRKNERRKQRSFIGINHREANNLCVLTSYPGAGRSLNHLRHRSIGDPHFGHLGLSQYVLIDRGSDTKNSADIGWSGQSDLNSHGSLRIPYRDHCSLASCAGIAIGVAVFEPHSLHASVHLIGPSGVSHDCTSRCRRARNVGAFALHVALPSAQRSYVQASCPERAQPAAVSAFTGALAARATAPPGRSCPERQRGVKAEGKTKGRGTGPCRKPVCTWGWRGTERLCRRAAWGARPAPMQACPRASHDRARQSLQGERP